MVHITDHLGMTEGVTAAMSGNERFQPDPQRGAVSGSPDSRVGQFQQLQQVGVQGMLPGRLPAVHWDADPSTCPTGYQRQLTYRHRDGSYSAFGERDASGSMW